MRCVYGLILSLSMTHLLMLDAAQVPVWMDLSCDHATYSQEDVSCLGHVELQASPFSVHSDALQWYEKRQVLLLKGAPIQAEYAPVKEMSDKITVQAEKMTAFCDASRRPKQLMADTCVQCRYGNSFHVQGDRLLIVPIDPSKEESSSLNNCLEFQNAAKQFQCDLASVYSDAKSAQGQNVLLLEGAPVKAEYLPVKGLSDKATVQAGGLVIVCDAKQQPRRVTAQDQVHCCYKDALHARGDHLCVTAVGELPTYKIVLEALKEEYCHVETSQGFKGAAKAFTYDTACHIGETKQFDGQMRVELEGGSQLHVIAEQLTWDEERGHVTAQGSLKIALYKISGEEVAQTPYCTLTAQGRFIAQCQLRPQFACQRIQIDGPMQLHHIAWGKLEGSGRTLIDCVKSKIVASGLRSSTGEVALEHQMRLETAYGKMQSDRLDLEFYPNAAHTFSLHAQGSVGVEATRGQYALAHELHYDTRTHEGKLLGKPSQRVLFWEPRYDASLSALSCQYTLCDPTTGGMRVKGNGDVRMTLFDTERKKLLTRFPQS